MKSMYCFSFDKDYSTIWGARAIYDHKSGYLDILPDRQQVHNPENFEPLKQWLMKTGMKAIRDLVRKKSLSPSSCEILVSMHDDYIIKATPNQSYGYMYIVAHPVKGTTLEEEMKNG